MKDRRTSARRRAIRDLFRISWSPQAISRVLKITKRDIEQELRKALQG